MSSQPGEAGIPYTHREVFLASPNAVGQGLDTFGNIGNTDLQSEKTIDDVLSNPDSRRQIKQNDRVFSELLKSKYLNVNFEPSIAALYLERNTPNIGTENGYDDIQQLINDETLANWEKEDINWLLGTQLGLSTLVNNANKGYLNDLMQSNEIWMEYWKPLSSYGFDTFNENTLIELAKYSVDSFNDNTNGVFQNSGKRTHLLEQQNGLHESSSKRNKIENSHPTAIISQSISPSVPSHGHYGSPRGSDKSSPYTGEIVALLDRSPRLRRYVLAGKVGEHINDLSVVDVINGNHGNFFELLKNTFHDEFIADTDTSTNDRNYDEYGKAAGSINFNTDNLFVTGGTHSEFAQEASITFQPFDVSGYSSIAFEGSLNQTKDYDYNTEYDESYVSVNGNRITSSSLGAINITDHNTININVQAGASYNLGSTYETDKGHVEITDISIT